MPPRQSIRLTIRDGNPDFRVYEDFSSMVTASQARDGGVVGAELNRYVADGRLHHLGHGLYRLARHVPTELDVYAEAALRVGDDAYIYGESVLAMHGLALVNPARVSVASPKRIRRRLPDWVCVVHPRGEVRRTLYDGIPSQPVADAIRACSASIMTRRLADAVDEARRRGLVTRKEHELLRKELGCQ